MKKVIFLILSVLLVLFFNFSCTNRKSSGDELKTVTLTKLYTIEGYPEETDSEKEFTLGSKYSADNKGFCYFEDKKTGSIKVFDENGTFYGSISKSGMGPEEIEEMNAYYVYQDTVFVVDNKIKIKKFSKKGEYLGFRALKTEVLSLFEKIYALNDSVFLVKYATFKRLSDDIEMRYKVAFTDRNMNVKSEIFDNSNLRSRIEEWYLTEPVVSVSENEIFVSQRSKNAQNISVYSHDGELLRQISKNFPKIKYTKEHLVGVRDFYSENFFDKSSIDKWFDYKFCVSDILSDKYGNAWVLRGNFATFPEKIFDIYNGEKAIARYDYTVNEEKAGEMGFCISKYFYVLDYYNNKIDVYDYAIK